MSRVLIVGNCFFLKQRLSNEHFQVQYFLENRADTTLMYDNEFSIEAVRKFAPDMIWFAYVGSMTRPDIMDQCLELGIPLGLFASDFMRVRDTLRDATTSQLTVLMSTAKNKMMMEEYERELPGIMIRAFSSRCIDSTQFYNRQLEKEYDIVYYGSNDVLLPAPLSDVDEQWFVEQGINQIPEVYNFYPLRKRIYDILKKNGNRYRVKLLDPCGGMHATVKNAELSELLNKSHMAVATCSRVDYIMNKYTEICASNCVILGNSPSDFESTFGGNIVELSHAMTDEEILEKIDRALENKEWLQETGERMAEVMKSEHGYDVALRDFNAVTVEALLSYNRSEPLSK
jgi:hypothetical protein